MFWKLEKYTRKTSIMSAKELISVKVLVNILLVLFLMQRNFLYGLANCRIHSFVACIIFCVINIFYSLYNHFFKMAPSVFLFTECIHDCMIFS